MFSFYYARQKTIISEDLRTFHPTSVKNWHWAERYTCQSQAAKVFTYIDQCVFYKESTLLKFWQMSHSHLLFSFIEVLEYVQMYIRWNKRNGIMQRKKHKKTPLKSKRLSLVALINMQDCVSNKLRVYITKEINSTQLGARSFKGSAYKCTKS